MRQAILTTLKTTLKITVSITTIILLYKTLNWLGLKGIIGLITGMTIMAITFLHPKANQLVQAIIKITHSNEQTVNELRNNQNTNSKNTTQSPTQTNSKNP